MSPISWLVFNAWPRDASTRSTSWIGCPRPFYRRMSDRAQAQFLRTCRWQGELSICTSQGSALWRVSRISGAKEQRSCSRRFSWLFSRPLSTVEEPVKKLGHLDLESAQLETTVCSLRRL